MKRVWVVLQNNNEDFIDTVDVVGVYSTYEQAEKVQKEYTEKNNQYYYIQDVMMD